MKPFYSIQELSDLLNESVFNVADGLIANGITPIHRGEKADLSKWDYPTVWDGGQLFVISGGKRDTGPAPSHVIVATDFLPESWKRCIEKHGPQIQPEEESLTPANQPRSWQEKARAIADEIAAIDANSGAYDSVKNIADRVAEKMRAMGKEYEGPRGPLAGSTILREALQGGLWLRKTSPGKQG